MNAIQFIQQHGIDKAREVVKGAPEWASHFDGYLYSEKQFHEQCFLLSDLKRLVESVENIEFYGGFDAVKFKLKRAEFNQWLCISTPHEDGFAEWYVENAKQAIADYESIYSDNDMGDDSHIENHISKNCKVIVFD